MPMEEETGKLSGRPLQVCGEQAENDIYVNAHDIPAGVKGGRFFTKRPPFSALLILFFIAQDSRAGPESQYVQNHRTSVLPWIFSFQYLHAHEDTPTEK